MEPLDLLAGDLMLRPWEATDAAALWKANQDPEILRWTGLPADTPERAFEFVTETSERAWASGMRAYFGVFDRATGELLGGTSLTALDAPPTVAEVGYWVAPWARGRAVAERATRAMAVWAFSDLKLERLRWGAIVGNHTSRLVALRLGFRIEGVARHDFVTRDGVAADSWVATLLPHELTADDHGVAPPGSVVARRAAVFSRPQPVLGFVTDRGIRGSLRAPAAGDIFRLIEQGQDPEALRWTTMPRPYRREHAEWFIDHAVHRWAQGGAVVCAIAGDDDQLVGTMELRLDDDPALAEVGFAMVPWARGRGIASAALRRLCEFAFDDLGVLRITWKAYVGNEGSRRVAEKAGFTMEGTMRGGVSHLGERMDAWTAGVLAEDYRETQ
jgi:RimJ/RimL family protein N-acetyltransferase